ncbi:MAG: acetylglutamate kinase [Planctomycetota bacterium]
MRWSFEEGSKNGSGRLCIKVGGAQLRDPEARREFAEAISAAREQGYECVIVHGGGDQIRELSKRLSIEDEYHDGLRITDAQTAEVALCVLAGSVNKALVQSLQDMGVPAVGLCGADGGTFTAKKHTPKGQDLGFVGQIDDVDPRLVDALLQSGFTPVLATLGPRSSAEPTEPLYNINADTAAGPLARALGCDAMLFLTDVEAVLDQHGVRIPRLCPEQCERLREDDVLRGGMLPKTEAASLAKAELGPGRVKIASAKGPDAVLTALGDQSGTEFEPRRRR